MILSSKQHYAIALDYLRDVAEANLTLEEKHQLQREGRPLRGIVTPGGGA